MPRCSGKIDICYKNSFWFEYFIHIAVNPCFKGISLSKDWPATNFLGSTDSANPVCFGRTELFVHRKMGTNAQFFVHTVFKPL